MSADICVAPGGGVKLKMLEYMMSGNCHKEGSGRDRRYSVLECRERRGVCKENDVLEGRVNLDFQRNRKIVKEKHDPKVAVDKILNLISNLY